MGSVAIKVTVNSLPAERVCVACRSTELQLRAKGIPFEKVILEGDLLENFKDQGMASAPVVVVDLEDGATWTWSGYRHSEIARLKELFEESLAA